MVTKKKLWPADKVERRKVSKLVPYAKNARIHSPEQVQQIAASMQEWGWTNPILVDEAGGIIAGHGRVLAAQVLKWPDVPVMVAKGWTDAQKRAYAIADNQLALAASWDQALLSAELSDLKLEGFEVGLIGFRADELEGLTDVPNFEPGSIEDQGRLDQKSPTTCPACGHVWTA